MIHDGKPLLRGCNSRPVLADPVPVGPARPIPVGLAVGGLDPVSPAGLVPVLLVQFRSIPNSFS